MKLLIIGNDISVIQALEGRCKQFGFKEIISCGHKEALEVFPRENPSHVIILEYDEGCKDEGADTWYSFLEKNLIGLEQIVVLYGNKNYQISNYLTLPIEILELRRALIGK